MNIFLKLRPCASWAPGLPTVIPASGIVSQSSPALQWSVWPVEYGRNYYMSLQKLDNKKQYGLPPGSVLGYSKRNQQPFFKEIQAALGTGPHDKN